MIINNLKLKELDLLDIFFCLNKMRIYENKQLVLLNDINNLEVNYVIFYLNKLKNKSKIALFSYSKDNQGTSFFYLYKTSEYIISLINEQLEQRRLYGGY